MIMIGNDLLLLETWNKKTFRAGLMELWTPHNPVIRLIIRQFQFYHYATTIDIFENQ